MDVQIVEQDATHYDPNLGLFDLVLLDAPCSGLGVVRKHPEIRWNRALVDVKSNGILQRKLLQTASKYVKSNGVLAYCVCSLHPEEGGEVIEHFLNLNPTWKISKTWITPVDSKLVQEELLDGFQLYILEPSSGNGCIHTQETK